MSDVVFRNARIQTGEGEARAMLVRGERLAAVGSEEDVLHAARGGARLIDLAGRTVWPGLIDSHLHLLGHGMALGQVDLAGATSLGEVEGRVRAHLRRLGSRAWVLGRGWDQDRIGELAGRFPDRRLLDAWTGGRPALIRRVCGHIALANTSALELARVGAETPDPPGGRIDRDAHGQPTGILREGAAIELVARHIPAPTGRQLRQAVARAAKDALAHGITGVHPEDVWIAGSFDRALDAYSEIGAEGIRLRVSLDVIIDAWPEMVARGLRSGDGDAWFRIGAVKIFSDGSLGGRTAALRAPYADLPTTSGMLLAPAEELARLVREVHARGDQLCIHAIGDRAAEVVLEAIQAALEDHPRPNHRHRLIHCQVLDPELMRRMARLGVVADIQPRFVSSDLFWADQRLGPERGRWAYAWRSLLEAGVVCAGGSDAPVEPIDPLLGIFAAAARTDTVGQPEGGWHPEEKLDLAQALRLFTEGAAYASFSETERGRLIPGRLADFVVLSGHPDPDEPRQWLELQVLQTYVGGRAVFSR